MAVEVGADDTSAAWPSLARGVPLVAGRDPGGMLKLLVGIYLTARLRGATIVCNPDRGEGAP